MNLIFDIITYYAFMATYLALFVVFAITLRRMQRALTRIADKLETRLVK